MKFIIALLSLSAMALPLRSGEYIKRIIPNEYIVHSKNFTKSMMVLDKISEEIFLIHSTNQNLKGLSPNFEYIGNFMESSPNDEFYFEQFHLKQISMPLVWDMNLPAGEEVIVAITDNEFELDHDDLKDSWHINSNEIPSNGIDDDGNGYIDDVIGWDFIGNDNDVDVLESPTHGTHVSGIMAAKTGNGIGISSIGSNIKIMPLRWYGDEGRWTSALVAKTYYYAVDNGAKIISTSYNIDPLVDDQVYVDAIKYATANDVLIFNSAGNDRQKNAPREKLDDLVLVCSVVSKDSRKVDRKSKFSNYGEGIDICAPGDPIFSTVQRRYLGKSRYGSLEGTSMSAPLVASVTGFIWGQRPELTAGQVRDIILESADNIDEQNSRYKGMLGSGRLNVSKALLRIQ